MDVVAAVAADSFIVCSDCKDDALHIQPMQIKLAMRFSGERNKQDVNRSPELTKAAATVKAPPTASIQTGTVYFAFDKASLVATEKANLDALAVMKPSGIRVSGYTCDVGSEGYNLKLSERRAKSVADYLIAKGLSIQSVEGKGECCPASATDKKLNRRVEVSIEKSN